MFLIRQLYRSLLIASVICGTVALGTWCLSPLAAKPSQQKEILLNVLGLTWWTLSAPAHLLISGLSKGLQFVSSEYQLPKQFAPPPFSVAWNSQHAGRELVATALAVAVSICIYAPLVYYFLRRRAAYRAIVAFLIAQAAVALQIPQTVIACPSTLLLAAARIGRVLTWPAEITLRTAGMPLYMDGPGGSGPISTQYVAESWGMLVLLSACIFFAVLGAIATYRVKHAPRLRKSGHADPFG